MTQFLELNENVSFINKTCNQWTDEDYFFTCYNKHKLNYPDMDKYERCNYTIIDGEDYSEKLVNIGAPAICIICGENIIANDEDGYRLIYHVRCRRNAMIKLKFRKSKTSLYDTDAEPILTENHSVIYAPTHLTRKCKFHERRELITECNIPIEISGIGRTVCKNGLDKYVEELKKQNYTISKCSHCNKLIAGANNFYDKRFTVFGEKICNSCLEDSYTRLCNYETNEKTYVPKELVIRCGYDSDELLLRKDAYGNESRGLYCKYHGQKRLYAKEFNIDENNRIYKEAVSKLTEDQLSMINNILSKVMEFYKVSTPITILPVTNGGSQDAR